MTSLKSFLLVTLVISAGGCGADQDGPPDSSSSSTESAQIDTVVVETGMGRIAMELYPDRAPETVRNFLLHVRSGFYDSLTFHRVKPGFIIQAGRFMGDLRERTSPTPPIANEAENGLRNERGTVAMARSGGAHSAKSEFFINVVDNEALDFKDRTSDGFGYAVFGRVIEGMEVVDAIAAVPTTVKRRHPDMPVDPIVIERAYRKTP